MGRCGMLEQLERALGPRAHLQRMNSEAWRTFWIRAAVEPAQLTAQNAGGISHAQRPRGGRLASLPTNSGMAETMGVLFTRCEHRFTEI